MALIVVLITLCLQRYLNFISYPFQFNWAELYTDWLAVRIKIIRTGPGLAGWLILLAPIFLLTVLIFATVAHLLTFFGYWALGFILLWYCIDARNPAHTPFPEEAKSSIFIFVYRNLFAPLFWFFILGPIGLALYYIVLKLTRHLSRLANGEFKETYFFAWNSLAILDWLPMRLLGLTFALVSHFSTVFADWRKTWTQGLVKDLDLLERWGELALHTQTANITQPVDLPETVVPSTEQLTMRLIDKSLILWLIIMGVFTIGMWIRH